MVFVECFNQKKKLILVHPHLVATFIHGKKIVFLLYISSKAEGLV